MTVVDGLDYGPLACLVGTWRGEEGLDENQLPPFVSTVPYGPSEERRLLEQEHYIYF